MLLLSAVFASTLSSPDPNCSCSWSSGTPIASGPRQEHGTAIVGDDIYIIGGIPASSSNNDTAFTSISLVEKYAIGTNTWTGAAALPINVTHANAAAVDGRIFVLGALVGTMSDTQSWTAVPDCFVYDPAADAWTALPPMPADQARGASAMAVRGKTIFVAGGQTVVNLRGQDSVDTVSAYDTEAGTWRTLPRLPAPRDHVVAQVIDGTLFVIGGRNHSVIADTVFALDLDAPPEQPAAWVTKAAMPTARGGLSAGVIGHRIFAFGGEENPDSPVGIFNNSEAYDVETDRWARLEAMPHPRHGTAAATHGGRIYIPGGGTVQGAGPSRTLEIFGCS